MKNALALVLVVSAHALAQTSQSDAPRGPQPLKSNDGIERYRYAGEVPLGFTLVEQPRWGLTGAGTGVFAAAWLASGIGGALMGNGLGFIPLVGPFREQQFPDPRVICRGRWPSFAPRWPSPRGSSPGTPPTNTSSTRSPTLTQSLEHVADLIVIDRVVPKSKRIVGFHRR